MSGPSAETPPDDTADAEHQRAVDRAVDRSADRRRAGATSSWSTPWGAPWPAPTEPPPRPVLLGAAASALLAVAALPAGRPGLGWMVTALGMATAVVVATRRTGWGGPGSAVWSGGWALLAAALVSMAGWRDAPWLVGGCLIAAIGAASLAVAGRAHPSLLVSAAVLPVAALRGLVWVGRATRRPRVAGRGRAVVVGLVTVAVLVVFGALLGAGDAAFGALLDRTLGVLTVDAATADTVAVRVVWGVAVAAGVLGMVFLRWSPLPAPPPSVSTAGLRRSEWAVPLAALVALFAVFAAVQAVTHLGPRDQVALTAGLTYAQYARQGFFELLLVGLLALAVILAGARFAIATTPAAQRLKRGLLVAFALLVLVVVIAAFGRMWRYQEAFGFTTSRLLVLTVEVWLGACFLLVAFAVLRGRQRGAVRAMVVAGALVVLGLAGLDPERLVAAQNVARFAETGRIDVEYLSQLSADAVPALAGLPATQRACALAPQAADLAATPDDWRSANLSRTAARALLHATPVPPCRSR